MTTALNENKMSKAPFERVALMARQKTAAVHKTLIALKDHLSRSLLSYPIVLEEKTAQSFNFSHKQDFKIVAADDLSLHADLLIVIGGDGSLLHAARIAASQNLPVLGVNRGKLGFLTDIHPDHLEQIDNVLQGDYQQEQRALLAADIYDLDGQRMRSSIALNDVVLLRRELIRLIEFDIHIDGQFVCHQRADGLITATPTGSTAYALSGGGPILDPRLDVLVLVPMFAHTLSSRPIVISSNSHVHIRVAKRNAVPVAISFDGDQIKPVPAGGEVRIHRAKAQLTLIHPTTYNYFDTLRYKLHWAPS